MSKSEMKEVVVAQPSSELPKMYHGLTNDNRFVADDLTLPTLDVEKEMIIDVSLRPRKWTRVRATRTGGSTPGPAGIPRPHRHGSIRSLP